MSKGFTLIELLVVILVLIIVMGFVIAVINPLEQLNRARDRASNVNAGSLLSAVERYQASHEGETPEIKNSVKSTECQTIIEAGPVYNVGFLDLELSDWFVRQMLVGDMKLYLGITNKRTKVCYQVKSIRDISNASRDGCNVAYLYYLCVP